MNWNLIWPILMVILANTFYNICMKSMPSNVNPFGALMITYLVAAIISAIIFVFMVGSSNVISEMSRINWTSIVLALAVVALEVGYVFVYRAGWTVNTASVVANIGLACVLIVVGYLLYNEDMSFQQILGIVVCMAGLVLINIWGFQNVLSCLWLMGWWRRGILS